MWEFTEIRQRAIQELSEAKSLGSIEKVEYGKSYQVKEWLMEGYIELLRRAETLTDEESERLGWRTAAKLLLLREQYLSTILNQWAGSGDILCGNCGQMCANRQYRYRYCAPHGRYYGGYIHSQTNRHSHDFAEAIRKELEVEL